MREGKGPTEEVLDRIADGSDVDWKRLRESRDLTASQIAALEVLAQLRTAPPRESPSGPSAAAGFELLEEIGRGAFGRVHRARDRLLGRDVAIKVLREWEGASGTDRERFLEEARTLAKLDHPNIVRIHSIDEHGSELRIVLELVDGVTLEQLAEQGGRLDAVEAARIGSDVCRALAALHAVGLAHGDVKPKNVMRAKGGRVVLLDFGLTRTSMRAIGEGDQLVCGTPLFLPPELVLGRGTYEPASDLYALGVVLYWLVSGSHPYGAVSLEELRAHALEARPVPLVDRRPDVPSQFAAIVDRAIAGDRERRFDTAGELEAALHDFLAGTPDGRKSRAPAPIRRRRAFAIAAGALLTLAAAFFAAEVLGRAKFEFESSLCAVRNGVDVPLPTGSALRVGDSIVLKARSNAPFHAYVFNEDSEGRLYSLFPLGGFDLSNPLPADEDLLLPGNLHGERQTWLVDSAGGTESFLIIASTEVVEEAEALRKEVPEASPDAPLVTWSSLSPRTWDAIHRGVGKTAHAEELPSVEEVGRLSELFALAADGSDSKPGVVWRLVRVRNVGP